jgi:hypothetical protein
MERRRFIADATSAAPLSANPPDGPYEPAFTA